MQSDLNLLNLQKKQQHKLKEKIVNIKKHNPVIKSMVIFFQG